MDKEYILNTIIFICIAIITVVSLVVVFNLPKENRSLAGLNTTDCAVSTVATSTIGHQESTTLLAAASNRAWAIIEQSINDVANISTISFDNGAAATLNTGIQLQAASTTHGSTKITFGLSTEFPYTGAVTGITDTSSTTIRITQCLYN